VLQLLSLIWENFLINPMVNVTIVLARVLFNNFGLAIIVFTLIMRGITLPLTLRQVHSQRKMSQLQPQLNEISKRVKDPKKRSEETMKLYKEAGASPAGCLLPMLIQFPIWIALYQVIQTVLGSTPEKLIDLSSRLYPWSFIQQAVPLGNHFLLWDMGKSAQDYLSIGTPLALIAGASVPVLVAASMWIQQKLTMTQASMTAANQSQAQTNQTMLWMMPLMFGYFTLNVPTGLAIYWLITNVVGIIMNYYVFGGKGTSFAQIFLKMPGAAKGPAGRGGNAGRRGRPDRTKSLPVSTPTFDTESASETGRSRSEKRGANGRNGRGGSKRKDDRGGGRPGAEPTRSGPQPGGGGGP
jgi:YidC/Oxa1 family membrane protein insertase